jgi:hypothetical protein
MSLSCDLSFGEDPHRGFGVCFGRFRDRGQGE